MRVAVSLLLWMACGPRGADSGTDLGTDTPVRTIGVCSPMRPGTAPPTNEADLEALMQEVRLELFPQLASIPLDLVELDSETDYFQANLDFGTVSDPPFERDYRVLYNPSLFEDGPTQPAIAAILAHEMTHILDYTEMESSELVEFGIWYATSDTAEYERQTDESAMWLGCAEGLIDYRLWLYDNIPADAVEDKERTYFTPDEIREWVAEHS
ncbi:MAG: hypothetical protein ACJATT_001724 [Myxococcota bacterium]|jgi:hypothetical protein